MKLLSLIALLWNCSAHSADVQSFNGRYISSTPNGSIYLDVGPNGGNLVVTMSSGEWNSRIKGNSYQFICADSLCKAPIPELHRNCLASITLLETDNFVFKTDTPGACVGNHRFKPYTGSSSSSSWNLVQTVDSNGVLSVTASVENSKEKNSLIMKCTAPSPSLTMSYKVNEVLWRAVTYSVNNKQESLRIVFKVKNDTYELNQWTLVDGNLIVRGDAVTDAEIAALRSSGSIKMKLLAIGAGGQSTELQVLEFSLKGSSQALPELKKRCTARPSSTLSFVE